MTDKPSAPASRLRHWLLVVSLVLNVFLIGAIAAGLVVRHGPPLLGHHRPAHFLGMPSPHKIRDALPESAQAVLDGVFEAHRQEMRSRLGRLREARRNVAAAIRAEPFIPAALESAFAELRAREVEVAAEAHGAFAELAAKLDRESRAHLADLVDRHHRREAAPSPPPE